MGLGEITKQFAKEAIESQVKDVLSIPETPAAEKPGVPAAPEPVGATIIRQVQAMQAALKENEELVVLFHTGQETLRVLDVFQASPQVIVLAGFDAEKNITRIV